MKKAKITKYISLIVFVFLIHPLFYIVNAKDCYPSPPNPELILNGNFELGFFGFKTTYDTNFIKFPKNIKITTNPFNEYYTFDSCPDPTTPNGKFLIVNGNDLFDGLHIVWEQEVDVIPHNYYEFKYMYCNIDARVDTNKNLPIIQVSFNEEFFDTVYVPKETCFWQTRSFIWYSGENQKLTIRFRDLQLKYFGNDFALDEISLKSLCSVQACAGQNQEICAGDTIILGDISNQSAIQGFKPYKFKWYPEENLDSPFSPNPLAYPEKTTTYYLEVTDSLGCVSIDSVTVVVHFRPLAKIRTNKEIPICPCDSIILSATEGLTYHWSTGDTTSSIIVRESGYYSLWVQNHFGCVDTTGIWVEVLPISTKIKFDTVFANIGERISIPLKLVEESNLFVCDYDSFKVLVTYNPTILLPLNHTPIVSNSIEEKIEIVGKTTSNLIDSLLFFVTLGNDTSSSIKIESFRWKCEKVDIQTFDGKLIIQNVCKEGGDRLFDIHKKISLTKLPNPLFGEVSLSFTTIEKGLTVVKIINNLGETVRTLFNQFVEPGEHFTTLDSKELNKGLYFLVLETPTTKLVEKIVILN